MKSKLWGGYELVSDWWIKIQGVDHDSYVGAHMQQRSLSVPFHRQRTPRNHNCLFQLPSGMIQSIDSEWSLIGLFVGEEGFE